MDLEYQVYRFLDDNLKLTWIIFPAHCYIISLLILDKICYFGDITLNQGQYIEKVIDDTDWVINEVAVCECRIPPLLACVPKKPHPFWVFHICFCYICLCIWVIKWILLLYYIFFIVKDRQSYSVRIIFQFISP